MERAAETGKALAELPAELAERHPSVGEVHSIGLLGVIERVRDRRLRLPMALYDGASPEMEALQRYLLKHWVYVHIHWHIILIVPPLIITPAQLAEVFAVLDWALTITDAVCTV